MGVLTLPRCSPLYGSQKPGIGSQIEWGHPLARGLAICIPMIEGAGAPRDLVRGLSLVAAGSPSWAPGGTYYDAVGERHSVSGAYALPFPGISTMVRFTPRLIDSAAHHLFAATDSGVSIWMFKAQITSGNVARCWFRNGGVSGATTLVSDKPYTVTGKYTSGGTQNVYLNGRLDGTAGAATSATSLLGAVEVGVSVYDDVNPASVIECAYVWNRELTADEVAWLHLEPYAFLISPVRRTYFPSTTPSGAIDGASAGSATVSGTLTGTGALASAAAGAATCQGTATGNGACAGAAAGVATVTATLTAAGALAGSSAGTATVAGSLGSESPIAGSCAGAASCSGTVTGNGSLSATDAGVATVTAVLLATGALAGSSAGTSTASLQNGVELDLSPRIRQRHAEQLDLPLFRPERLGPAYTPETAGALNRMMQAVQQVVRAVRNRFDTIEGTANRFRAMIAHATSIPHGAAVHIIGGDESAVALVARAQASQLSSMPADGLADGGASGTQDGIFEVVRFGVLRGLDTSGWSVGTTLYVGTDGLLTSTQPLRLVQHIATVIVSRSTDGMVWVECPGGSENGLVSYVPPGVVAFMAWAYGGSHWLPANGGAISRTTYAGLFAAIGTTYGVGDGSTTFNKPNIAAHDGLAAYIKT